jgi:tetratricopeptide (TPR) repeat protein
MAAHAGIKTFIKEHSYQAGELDSKASCRAIAMDQVKRILLEELGAYVKGKTTVKNHQLEDDEIKTLTAGVVQTKLLEERWDGKEYWLKAELRADPDEVASSIEKLKEDEELVRELEETRAEAAQAMEEIQSLKQQLARSDADREKQEQYDEAIHRLTAADWFETGTALKVAGDYEGAARAYDQAVLLRPDDPKAYVNRGIAYIQLGDYGRAANDLDKASELNPSKTNVYFKRVEQARTHFEGGAAAGKKSTPLVLRGERVPSQDKDSVRRQVGEKQKERRRLLNPSDRRPSALSRDQLRKERELQRKQRVEELRKKKDLKRQERQKRDREPRPEERRKGRED